MENTASDQTSKELLKKVLPEAMSYAQFRTWVKELAEKHGTSGPEQTEAYKHYTELNDRRMRRWDKTLKLTEGQQETIRDYEREVFWLVITESWCGDAAPSLPVMNRISEINDRVTLRIIMRSEYPEVMDLFLTEGKRSIPKLIAIDKDTLEVVNTWGPLPTKATEIAKDYKAKHGSLTATFKEDLQLWFNDDKGRNISEDLLELLTLKEVGNRP